MEAASKLFDQHPALASRHNPMTAATQEKPKAPPRLSQAPFFPHAKDKRREPCYAFSMLFGNSWHFNEVAVDFGTSNMRIIRRNEGVVFDEPSLCCFERRIETPNLIAAGSLARPMLDRTPSNMAIRRPLKRGVLQDIEAAREMLRSGVKRIANGKSRTVNRGIFGIPADATQAEQSALLTAAREAGFRSVRLMAEPFLAALGADLPVVEPTGTMIVECGAGTTEVAVLSLGNICMSRSVRSGGDALDKAISDHLHFQHRFLIGEASAERLKCTYVQHRTTCSSAASSVTVKGRSLNSRTPASIEVPLSELDDVVERHVMQIVDVVRDVLTKTPPELSKDILDRGVVLTGGSSVTPLLKTMIEKSTGLTVSVAREPERCVAKGLEKMLG